MRFFPIGLPGGERSSQLLLILQCRDAKGSSSVLPPENTHDGLPTGPSLRNEFFLRIVLLNTV